MSLETITTADGRTVAPGARVFNFYDGRWVTVGPIDDEGWFDTTTDDGSRGPLLNGERVALEVPSSNPFHAEWMRGRDLTNPTTNPDHPDYCLSADWTRPETFDPDAVDELEQ